MEIIKIDHGQYLKDVIDAIKTNCIYYKNLPGIGATTLELLAERNSIILEPNVPVIRGKKMLGILGIYEKVSVDDIISYLLSKRRYKKILVTPESFPKLLAAAKLLDINLKEDYFLLFDECDRTIKDVAFRPKILLPMELFFQFKRKAFISATTITPTDPRFKEQGFEDIHIAPNYIVNKPINLIATNNIFLALRQKLEEIKNENICIFLNSTNLIGSIIKSFGLNDESVVYCSRESAQQLEVSGIKTVFDHLSIFKKYNFFTSRFYSAVDILMETNPTIIIISDLKTAVHTMVDPYCDTTQIKGRFRNGHKEVIHISNFDSELRSMNVEEVNAYLNGCENSYNDIKALRSSTLDQGSRDTLDAALELVPYRKFIYDDSSKNHYMVDNMVLEERVKHAYINSKNLVESYESFGYDVNFNEVLFPLNDFTLLKVKAGINNLDVVKSVIEAIKLATGTSDLFTLRTKQEVLDELGKSHPLIVDAYKLLGEAALLKCGYSKKLIKRAMAKKLQSNDCKHFGFLNYLQSQLPDGGEFTVLELKDIFDKGISEHHLTIKPKLSTIKEIFNLSKRKTVRRGNIEHKGYNIINCRLLRSE